MAILKKLQPDPKPTEEELQESLKVIPNLVPGVEERMPDLRRKFAAMHWYVVQKQKNPDLFLEPFVPDIEEYNKYRKSPLWKQIRVRVLAAAKFECAGCGGRATQIHHRDYRPRVLAGKDDDPLVPLCKRCHGRIHEEDSWQATERSLAELVARNNSRQISN